MRTMEQQCTYVVITHNDTWFHMMHGISNSLYHHQEINKMGWIIFYERHSYFDDKDGVILSGMGVTK